MAWAAYVANQLAATSLSMWLVSRDAGISSYIDAFS